MREASLSQKWTEGRLPVGRLPSQGISVGICGMRQLGSSRTPPPHLPRFGGGDERGGELFVEGEEVFHPVPVAGERLWPVTAVHRPVQVLVRLEPRRGHRQRVIQIGQRRGRVLGPRIQHRRRRRLHRRTLLGRHGLRPGVVVVNKLGRIAEIEPQSSAGLPDPCLCCATCSHERPSYSCSSRTCVTHGEAASRVLTHSQSLVQIPV